MGVFYGNTLVAGGGGLSCRAGEYAEGLSTQIDGLSANVNARLDEVYQKLRAVEDMGGIQSCLDWGARLTVNDVKHLSSASVPYDCRLIWPLSSSIPRISVDSQRVNLDPVSMYPFGQTTTSAYFNGQVLPYPDWVNTGATLGDRCRWQVDLFAGSRLQCDGYSDKSISGLQIVPFRYGRRLLDPQSARTGSLREFMENQPEGLEFSVSALAFSTPGDASTSAMTPLTTDQLGTMFSEYLSSVNSSNTGLTGGPDDYFERTGTLPGVDVPEYARRYVQYQLFNEAAVGRFVLAVRNVSGRNTMLKLDRLQTVSMTGSGSCRIAQGWEEGWNFNKYDYVLKPVWRRAYRDPYFEFPAGSGSPLNKNGYYYSIGEDVEPYPGTQLQDKPVVVPAGMTMTIAVCAAKGRVSVPAGGARPNQQLTQGGAPVGDAIGLNKTTATELFGDLQVQMTDFVAY